LNECRISGNGFPSWRDIMIASTIVTPEQVMSEAIAGRLSKHALTGLLTPRARTAFLAACAKIEMGYTEACRAKGDPCLESGCSMEGDRCLQPLLAAGDEYDKACGTEWAQLFADVANREPSWRASVQDYNVG
jgi:hypothetical protein